MRSLHPVFCLALPAVAVALSAGAGCGFPDVTFTGEASASSAGGGTASSSASSASTVSSSDAASSGGGEAGSTASASGEGGGAAGSTATAGGDGGATASSSASAGGDGGAAASSSASSSASGSGGGGPVDCDADDDGYRSMACEGGTDCNDDNPLVHPGQPSTFYGTPITMGGGFDYDCSGAEEREFRAVNCSNILPLCTAASNVFQADVPCGSPTAFGTCTATCQFNVLYPNYVRKCH
ncbi:hypothetical protein WME99_27880 [Sorangium sp. So ce136]|uniref:hypothetical protein n=1 Tax=Sorangium sp. So ce136 TaxID=3133284 RepID=UPI003F0F29BD